MASVLSELALSGYYNARIISCDGLALLLLALYAGIKLNLVSHPEMVFFGQSRRQSARLLVRRPGGRLRANG
ncbi:hypothetical protein TRIP_B250260 [uncultured Desulfatiglans sp.]|nr:hypothetical protein TRIP_B250260 [uncultured Desulfatiglans sp.]